MSKVFVTIKKSEFEEYLDDCIRSNDYDVQETYEGNEIVYLIEVPGHENLKVKVYSSVDRNYEYSRSKGTDAIRVFVFDSMADKPVTQSKKIYRVEGATSVWDRLTGLINHFLEEAENVETCESCGSSMAKRWAGGNKTRPHFWGCLRFPKCNATVSQSGKFKANTVVEKVEDRSKTVRVDASDYKDNRDIEDEMELEHPAYDVEGDEELDNEAVVPFKAPIEFDDDDLPIVNVIEVNENEDLIPASMVDTDEENLVYDFENFNPVQSRAFHLRERDENLVMATMTGSGKTIVSELKMNQAIMNGKKACYLSPLKAVTQERHDDWTGDHSFSDMNISIVTGDYQLTDKRKKELAAADIILMTSEMLGARIRNYQSEKNEFLMEIGCLVVDEVHLLGMGEPNKPNSRGPKLEVGLIDFCRLNQDCQIVLLSATIPNCDDLGDWCSVLNGKDTTIIKSDWRPCELKMNFVSFMGSTGYGSYGTNQQAMASAISENIDKRGNNSLCFVHSKKTSGPMLLNRLKNQGISAQYHNADLAMKDRIKVERAFRSKEAKTLVATATLAWGMNLPARDVHIMGIKRGMQKVHPYDIIQMAGRAGRPGFDTRGDCFIYLPDNTFDQDLEYCTNLPHLESLLNYEEELVFHLVAEVYNRIVRTPEQVEEWFNTSFASVLGGTINLYTARSLFEKLCKIRAIRRKQNSPEYCATPLGMISTWMYLNPYDIYGWYSNFSHLNNEKLWKEDDDVAISWAIGNVYGFINDGYITEDEANEMSSYDYMLRKRDLRCYGNSMKECYCIYKLLRGEKAGRMMAVQRGIKADSDRWIQAVGLIDSMYTKWGRTDFFKTLSLRIKYGCSAEQADLCRVKGVGQVALKKLWDANIKSPEDIVERPSRVIRTLQAKNGSTTVPKKIIKNARILLDLYGEEDDE